MQLKASLKTNSGGLNRVVGGLIKQMKFKVMIERLHKLIDFLFSDVPDEKRSEAYTWSKNHPMLD